MYILSALLIALETVLLVIVCLLILFGRKLKRETLEVLEVDSDAGSAAGREPESRDITLQRYFDYAIRQGCEQPKAAKVRQSGSIKIGKKTYPFKAAGYFNCRKPSFIWVADIRVFPMVWVTARFLYAGNKGDIVFKLFSAFTIAARRNDKIDSLLLGDYLSKMAWFPISYSQSEHIRWDPKDENCLQASISDGPVKAEVLFVFHPSGSLIKSGINEEHSEYYGGRISSFYRNYRSVNGMAVPSEIETAWAVAGIRIEKIAASADKIEYA